VWRPQPNTHALPSAASSCTLPIPHPDCRMMHASDLQWLCSSCPVGTSPPEQLLLFLQLLPSRHHPPQDQGNQGLPEMTGSSSWTQCTGAFTGCDVHVQAVAIAGARLLIHLAEAPTALQWASGRLPGAAAVQRQSGGRGPVSTGGAGGSPAASSEALVVRLALLGLLTPGQLGLAPSEGEAWAVRCYLGKPTRTTHCWSGHCMMHTCRVNCRYKRGDVTLHT
jgi:hypothetical protein